MFLRGSVLRSILLLSFMMAMISAAFFHYPIEQSKNSTRSNTPECVAVPGKWFGGDCVGGTCRPCRVDPLLCCSVDTGSCTSL